eukprot:RCo005933
MPEQVGLLGCGKMGAEVARHLNNLMKSEGQHLLIYNRTTDTPTVRSLQDEGAVLCSSPADLASKCTLMFSLLAHDKAALDVAAGDNGILHGIRDGSVYVEMSTILPETVREIAALLCGKGPRVGVVSCPVFGRPDAARAGVLLCVPAGKPEHVDRVEPFLRPFAKKGIVRVGEDPGQANVLKLTGNFMIASSIEMLSEAMTLGERNGVSRDTFMSLVKAFFPVPVFEGYGGRIAKDDFAAGGGFTVTLGQKDVGHMQTLARASGTYLPTADLVMSHLAQAQEAGRGDWDWAAVATVVREKSSIPTKQ